jgi:hypothetical protein
LKFDIPARTEQRYEVAAVHSITSSAIYLTRLTGFALVHVHLRGFVSSVTPQIAAAVIPLSATSSKTSSGVPIDVIFSNSPCGNPPQATPRHSVM